MEGMSHGMFGSMKTKRICFILGIVLFSARIIFSFIPDSPYEYLVKKQGDISVTKMIYQENLKDNKYLVFFLDEKGYVSCAIIKKTLFLYDILKISGKLSIFEDSSNYLYCSFEDNKNRYCLDWGILTDKKIEKVLINGEEMSIIDGVSNEYRICWKYSEEYYNTPPIYFEIIE